MKTYFEKEISQLQDGLKEFSNKHPSIARSLDFDEVSYKHPFVQHLFQAMSFLSARMMHQIDNQLIDLSEVLLEQLNPSTLNPKPSKAIVQIDVKNRCGSKGTVLNRNTTFRVKGAKEEVFFKTLIPLRILPIILVDNILHSGDRDTDELVIELMFDDNA